MSSLKIERVLALPAAVAPSTLYIVKSATTGLVDLHFTNNDGTETRHVISKDEIDSAISTAVTAAASGSLEVEVVADYAALAGFSTATVNKLALVLDATGDTTVTTGSALYVVEKNGGAIHKISEFESLDVTLDWANIANKPNVTVADIEDAVAKKHEHANITVLDKFTDTAGELLYDGNIIPAGLTSTEW